MCTIYHNAVIGLVLVSMEDVLVNKEVSVTFNDNKINLPRIVTIKLRDKIKIRCMMKKEPLLFHVMLKQGNTWFMLASSTQRDCIELQTRKYIRQYK